MLTVQSNIHKWSKIHRWVFWKGRKVGRQRYIVSYGRVLTCNHWMAISLRQIQQNIQVHCAKAKTLLSANLLAVRSSRETTTYVCNAGFDLDKLTLTPHFMVYKYKHRSSIHGSCINAVDRLELRMGDWMVEWLFCLYTAEFVCEIFHFKTGRFLQNFFKIYNPPLQTE